MASCSITSKMMLDIEECITELKRHFASEKTPINDDCTALHRLEEKAETVLQLGLKEKPGVFGVKRTYWDYICACFGASKRFHEGIKFVKSNSELKSSVGRGRALIRFCLIHKCLADTLQTCFIDEKTTRDFYLEQCLPLQPKLWSEFIAFLYDLNEIHFDLNPQSTELDISWPSFARKIFLPPGNQILPSVTMSFTGLNDISSELVNKLCDADISSEGENIENLDNETEHLVAANSELEADVLYLQKKCETLEQEICDAANTEGTLETISKNAEIHSTEKDMDSDSKMMNDNFYCQENSVKNTKDYIKDIDSELDFQSKSDDQCTYNSKTQCFEENLQNNLSNFSMSEHSELPLVSSESVLTVNKVVSSSTTSTNLFLQEKIDYLLQSETSPFHPEIMNSIQDLLLEMKLLLDTLKSGVDSVTDPVILSDFTRFQLIRQYLEKILLVELKKVTHYKIEKQNLEEYAFCMKTSALKQDTLICSLLEQVSSCVKENKTLHGRLCILKDKLQSFGLLRPDTESSTEFKDISDVGKISEDHVNLDDQISNNMPNEYLESLQIFKTSSANLRTLSMQATNLQLFLDASHKLNDNLISRIQDQELHMKGITKQLEEAHNLLAVMRKQHQKLQSAESIVKYDLQEKRRLLNKLKQQLEATRENCNLVRMKNSKSEAEWQDLRREFVLRNKQTSEESGFIDDKSIEDQSVVSYNACESDGPENFPDNEISMSNSNIESKYELKKNRLQLLEEQCQLLCTNLKNSSKKRKELDYRLESWCKAIENSQTEASKKNNLSVINTDKECKDNSERTTNEKINIDFNSDADSSLSSPEVGSFNSDCCSYIPHNPSATTVGLNLSLQYL